MNDISIFIPTDLKMYKNFEFEKASRACNENMETIASSQLEMVRNSYVTIMQHPLLATVSSNTYS